MSDDDTRPAEDSDDADRRSNERVPARVEVRFSEPNDAARALRAFSVNVSSGGLCLRTQRRYEIGATLELTMNVAGETYDLTGLVAWVREGAVGLRFHNMTAADRARLETLVATLRKEHAARTTSE